MKGISTRKVDVIRSSADGNIEDTGPLTSERMETVDEEFLTAAIDFIERQEEQDTPWFVWFNTTRMHILHPSQG